MTYLVTGGIGSIGGIGGIDAWVIRHLQASGERVLNFDISDDRHPLYFTERLKKGKKYGR